MVWIFGEIMVFMVSLMEHPASDQQFAASAALKMPISGVVKYLLLGLSSALLLLALGFLAWQTFRCCTRTHATYTQQNAVSSDVLCSRGGEYSPPQSAMVEEVTTDVYRLNRYVTPVQFPSSRSSQADEEQVDIQKVQGSLCFSVYYDQPQSRLVITILQLRGLQEHRQTCSLQSFVRLRVMWAGSEGGDSSMGEMGQGASAALWTVLHEWQTRIVKGSSNPLYGDQFSCILQQDQDLDDINLRMEVVDFDKFSRHTLLGEVRVRLRQLNISCPLEQHEDLQIPKKDCVGEVLLSLKFLPTSQRLEVGLLKVRTVLTDEYSDQAMYIKISIHCNQRKLRSQKTSMVTRCWMTVFNEVLIFLLPQVPVERCIVVVSVYEARTSWKSPKHLMGQLTVGKERHLEDEHWNLMMHSVRQPVAKWHGLLI